MASIELRNVRKSFGATEVVRGVDMQIRPREFVAFVGPSGSGKSTLLRMIAGLEHVTSGEILIDGSPVQDVAPAKRGLAMVFQSYALYPHMTVAENMSFNLRLAGISREEQDRKVREVARSLEMEVLLNRKPRQLSGGQMQRVAIGRAMVREPRAFLFDEPLSNLDAALQAQMRLELVRLHEKLATTMVYVTHDQLEAMTMADRIVVLNDGRVEQVGTPLDLYQRPGNLFVAAFIGAPKMNFFPGTLDTSHRLCSIQLENGAHLALNRPSPAVQVNKITVGIRPEHLFVDPKGEISGTVTVLEHLGARSYVHASTRLGNSVVCEAGPDVQLRIGEPVVFRVRRDFVHLFDSSGDAVMPSIQESSCP